MSDLAKRLAGLSPVQRQLLEKRLAAAQAPTAERPEAVAIVGMACRFPGAPNLAEFWRLISEQRDGVVDIPASRWDVDRFFDPSGEEPGKISVRAAALVDNIDQFDPQFFGITPREAAQMDPQQRLLLEVGWEALENSGRPADQFAGTGTGVYVGIGATDYAKVLVEQTDYFQQITPHSGTGNALSIAANRLSYIFDLHGPSMSVDTACSSSSLAVHLAVQSLRRGECDVALAGGVNTILTPETTIAFSKARMLSPDGRCRPFDAAANGYVRGEGCGVVVLKRLSDAIRDGDDVWATIVATAVNQDGRTSGISAPNGESQKACIRAALAEAALTPDDISYLEAHGTGTPLGDPIEMHALAEIFAGHSDATRCHVASVKANVGHMETVSGMAGLIKVVLMMRHEQIQPQTHFESLNPHIELEGTRLAIPTSAVPWPRDERPRYAGVSSFGFGGTNTHLIIRDADPVPATGTAADDVPMHVVKLAAKSESAISIQAEKLAAWLGENPDAALADVAYTMNTGRVDFNHRLALTATNCDELAERLEKLAAGKRVPTAKQGSVRSLARPKVAFLFTGQGSQQVGMGRALYESHPTFREQLDVCDDILQSIWDESLLSIIHPEVMPEEEEDARLHQTQYTQPALFAIEYALARLWQSWGVEPDVVMGHSVGEYVAACIAGVMSLEDGLRLIAERARLMQQVKRHGKMAVLFAPEERVAEAVAPFEEVTIAAANGPENTVISGVAEHVEQIAAQFEAEEIGVRVLQVSHAFHSPLMDEMLDDFAQFAAQVDFQPPRTELISNLTGRPMQSAPSAQYWRDHLRNAVRFADGMAHIANSQCDVLIEMGPQASLLGMGRRCKLKFDAAWLPSLRAGQDDWQVLLGSLAEFYCRGGNVDWRAVYAPWQCLRLLLPNYPFQREHHWQNVSPEMRWPVDGAPAGAAATPSAGHPLLGRPVSTVLSGTLFETVFSAHRAAYLVDHQVQGSPVAPAAAYVEQGLAAADELFGPGSHELSDLSIGQAMFLSDGARRRVQVCMAPESGGRSTCETHSRPTDDDSAEWTLHASSELVHQSQTTKEATGSIDLDAVRTRAVAVTNGADFYELIAERGLKYGPAFQVLENLHRTPSDATAEVRLSEAVLREAEHYHLHPALGDALLQSMAGIVPLEADGSFSPHTYMPIAIGRVRVPDAPRPLNGPLFTYALRTSADDDPSPETVEGNVYLTDESGHVLVAMERVRVQRIGRGQMAQQTDTRDWLYEIAWQEGPPASSQSISVSGRWLILADGDGLADELVARMAKRGEAALGVSFGTQFALEGDSATIDPLNADHYEQLLAEGFGDSQKACQGVVHLGALDAPQIAADDFDWDQANRVGAKSVIAMLGRLARHRFSTPPRLTLVTRGAQSIDVGQPVPVAVAQAGLWGLARVAAMEHPDLRPKIVDLDPSVDVVAAVDAIVAELDAADDEAQLAYRAGKRYVARLQSTRDQPSDADEARDHALSLPVDAAFQLRITNAGSLDALRFVPFERPPPSAGQVELEIHSAGLNFSDVLKALGLYPGIKDTVVPLGIEAAGVVTAVGQDVDRFNVGDEVMGVVPYAFASHALTAEYALVHKPATLSDDEACTVPITFLTAHYALVELARLTRGERVLIHAGAGGVGLAAIQIAQHLGAEVFATAGSDTKRDLLRSLGVKHVYNSRTLDFAEEVLADTNREGVDVVLNSLPGAAITKSLSLLRAYGRFLEIGKTDIYQDSKIGLLPFQDNLSYFAIDLDRMLRERPEAIRKLFADVMEHFERGHYRPLALTRFSAEQTVDAFRYMSARKNIGKVVVAMEQSAAAEVEPTKPGIRADGSYLITGGTGALGMQVAQWLVDEGAGGIVLASRREPSAEICATMDRWRAQGAQVVALQMDVTDADSVNGALRGIGTDFHPLAGVFHAAGVLADGVIADMTAEQFDRASAPKAAGALALHEAIADVPLDLFVMFSSVASVLGSPGQANYAAGNAVLDALAHLRRSQNLPATAINWGPWAGAGMAATDDREDAIKSRGMDLLQPTAALRVLADVVRTDCRQITVMDVHWDHLLPLLGARRPSLLADVAADNTGEMGVQVDHEFREKLLAADAETAQQTVRDYIRDELARIMGVEAETLEPHQPLSSYGIDSLLALELKNNLEGRLAFTLPMAALMEGPSIDSLAAETARQVTGGAALPSEDIRGAAESETWEPLVVLRDEGAGVPLVLLPSLGGDIRCYDELVQLLPADRPVVSIRPRGLDDDVPPHADIAEMVADYAAALTAWRKDSPFHLAGWSTAGIYAYALAHAMSEVGGDVQLLALFDTPLPTVFDKVRVDDDARFLCDIVNFTNQWRGSTMRIDYQKLTSLEPSARFQSALAEARKQGAIPDSAPDDYIRRIVEVGEANIRALQGYRPVALNGRARVHLFVPRTKGGLSRVAQQEVHEDGDLGWMSEIGQDLEIHEVAGDHFSMMFGEGARDLAKSLGPLM